MANERTTTGIVIALLLVFGLFGARFLAITPTTSRDLDIIFTADRTNQIVPNQFSFGPNCEVITPILPEIDTACAEQQATAANCNAATATRNPCSVKVNENCINYPITINNQRQNFKQGQTTPRSGYHLSLIDASSDIAYGYFSSSGTTTSGAYTQTVKAASILNGYSATYRISIDNDALTVNLDGLKVNFSKKLPACVQAGVAISDSPRLFGATVINNGDGTYTNVGNVQQYEINFPAQEKGSLYTPTPNYLGEHAMVLKPFVTINQNRINIMPELLQRIERQSSTQTAIVPSNTPLQEPGTLDKIIAAIKHFFARLGR